MKAGDADVGKASDLAPGISHACTRRAVIGTMAAMAPMALFARNVSPDLRAPTFIDRRAELLGIAGRLAALEEFRSPPPSNYLDGIDRHFARFSDHLLVQRLRAFAEESTRDGSPLGAWDLLALAFHLGAPPRVEPVVGYGQSAENDPWDGRRLFASREVALVRKFYRDADCARFFGEQAGYYRKIDHELRAQLKPADQWAARFVGLSPTEHYRPVVSLLGLADYGYFRVNYGGERRDTYTVFAAKGFDAGGMLTGLDYNAMGRMALHETIHAYANQVIDRNLAALLPAGKRLLDRLSVWSKVKDTFYNNPPFLLRESLVRASALVYTGEQYGMAKRAEEAAKQIEAGFEWMPQLLALLDEYRHSRLRYPNLLAFKSRMAEFFDKLTA